MDKIRVILAEDYPVVRIGIRNLLVGCEDIDVIGEACTGPEALRLTEQLNPDILLLDVELPGMDGIEITRRLKRAGSPVRILVLSAYEEKEFVLSLLEMGISGYLLKDEAAESIAEAIRGIAQGEDGWISRKIAARALSWKRDQDRSERGLTPREREILRLVISGKTNQGIAATLNLSDKTIEKHLSKIFIKLGVESRTDAAVVAIRDKLI